jgi:hypothetical protein
VHLLGVAPDSYTKSFKELIRESIFLLFQILTPFIPFLDPDYRDQKFSPKSFLDPLCFFQVRLCFDVEVHLCNNRENFGEVMWTVKYLFYRYYYK